MNAASLPYTVIILLLEMAAGSLAVLTVFDARGQVTRGYVKAGALTIVPLALLALWAALAVTPADDVDGYTLRDAWLMPLRFVMLAFTAVAAAHLVAAMLERRRAELALGAAGSVVGVAALIALAGLIGAPAWSDAWIAASLLVGAAVLGAALMAMMWGHWYLTSGRLPKEPMEQMSLLVLGAVLLQTLLVLVSALTTPRSVPLGEGFGVALAENPAFWLRVGVGLLFPIVLALLAWKSAQIRGMMSATGLLYIALGAVLAGEVLARGLLFSTALPV